MFPSLLPIPEGRIPTYSSLSSPPTLFYRLIVVSEKAYITILLLRVSQQNVVFPFMDMENVIHLAP